LYDHTVRRLDSVRFTWHRDSSAMSILVLRTLYCALCLAHFRLSIYSDAETRSVPLGVLMGSGSRS
jgi:hypothetical protein